MKVLSGDALHSLGGRARGLMDHSDPGYRGYRCRENSHGPARRVPAPKV